MPIRELLILALAATAVTKILAALWESPPLGRNLVERLKASDGFVARLMACPAICLVSHVAIVISVIRLYVEDFLPVAEVLAVVGIAQIVMRMFSKTGDRYGENASREALRVAKEQREYLARRVP